MTIGPWRARIPEPPGARACGRTREHSTNATLLERNRRRAQERTGGELEERRPTASPCVGKLIGLVSFPDCPRFVPGNSRFRLRGLATTTEFGVLPGSCMSAPASWPQVGIARAASLAFTSQAARHNITPNYPNQASWATAPVMSGSAGPPPPESRIRVITTVPCA
jgi:hypothetical protein